MRKRAKQPRLWQVREPLVKLGFHLRSRRDGERFYFRPPPRKGRFAPSLLEALFPSGVAPVGLGIFAGLEQHARALASRRSF